MGSSCVLCFGDNYIAEQRVYVPDLFSSLFQESDKIIEPDEDDEYPNVRYEATRQSVLKRLDLMGCTERVVQQRFKFWQAKQIIRLEQCMEEWSEEGNNESIEFVKAVTALSWNRWTWLVHRYFGTDYMIGRTKANLDIFDRHVEDDEESWLWIDGFDSLISLRAVLMSLPEARNVTLDVTQLVTSEDLDVNDNVCAREQQGPMSRGRPSGPAIVLTEGASDIEILKASLRHFGSDIADFVTFLDHREFKVDGGASYVVKFLKVFAAARVPAIVVAVFDNDVAGLSAFGTANTLKLPHNMVCIHLPETELARDYPTIGPQGLSNVDVNGKACSMELFLGRAALSTNGSLKPVRWTSYDRTLDAYQGQVEGKEEVQGAFLRAMNGACTVCIDEFPEMQAVWNAILHAISQAAEALLLQASDSRFD